MFLCSGLYLAKACSISSAGDAHFPLDWFEVFQTLLPVSIRWSAFANGIKLVMQKMEFVSWAKSKLALLSARTHVRSGIPAKLHLCQPLRLFVRPNGFTASGAKS
ncbi:hypothetical protein PQQ88_24045 [Paraburkholderia caledonica]|uniref:hypothetical protein n=1 Tax=Paraburkholderia caledonica TaxID=134536 RepID=UPI000DEF66F7|nr:hypothetical protein [Paraburkholderia caledonica]AXF16934.1 hypothetical protein CUJ87_21395 [Paraburkholderia caledonica]